MAPVKSGFVVTCENTSSLAHSFSVTELTIDLQTSGCLLLTFPGKLAYNNATTKIMILIIMMVIVGRRAVGVAVFDASVPASAAVVVVVTGAMVVVVVSVVEVVAVSVDGLLSAVVTASIARSSLANDCTCLGRRIHRQVNKNARTNVAKACRHPITYTHRDRSEMRN